MFTRSRNRKLTKRSRGKVARAHTGPRQKAVKTEEIQPMVWRIDAIPYEMGNLVGMALPDSWRTALESLKEVEHQPPVKGLSLMLQALAPEILYVAHNAFHTRTEKRPKYWLVADATHGRIAPDKLVMAIHTWLGKMFTDDVARSVAQAIRVEDVIWEPMDTINLTDPLIRAALPGMTARWLVRNQFHFRLSDANGVISSWPMKVIPTRDHVAELITWPPVMKEWKGQHSYSYYLRLWVKTMPITGQIHLFIRPGIRRWVSHPMAHPKPNGGMYVDLAWKRRKFVYFAFENQRWLSNMPGEISLMGLALTRLNNSVVWVGRLQALLAQLRPDDDIPDPVHLLSQPAEFQPTILISYDHRAGQSSRHEVQPGLEAADWAECFRTLCLALPPTFIAGPAWHRCNSYIQQSPSVAARFFSSWKPDEIRNGAIRMGTPTTIGVISNDAENWLHQVLLNLGLPLDAPTDQPIRVMADDGQSAIFHLKRITLPVDLLSELPDDIQDAQMQHNAEKQRARKIELALVRQVDGISGLLVELPNYPRLYGTDSLKARRDPKLAIRWGAARAGWVTQFIQPKEYEPENYGERVRNGVRDLFRMLDYHVNTPYNGFKRTTLPKQIDIVGLYLIDVNARDRGERKVMQPIIVQAPAGAYTWKVCLPSPNGAQWQSYHDALLRLPDLTAEFDKYEGVKAFYKAGLASLAIDRPTLVLVPEHNVGRFWPGLHADTMTEMRTALDDVLPVDSNEWRIARIRSSNDGTVPLISQQQHFGRFAGLFCNDSYPNVYYSVQERPLSASRKTGVRQLDRWRKMGWNPSTLEITLIRLQPEDVMSEWAFLIHRLRQESSHSDAATLLPEPLHSASKAREYVMRLQDEGAETA